MGHRDSLKGKSYVGKNHFGKYRTCGMNVPKFINLGTFRVFKFLTYLISEKVVVNLTKVPMVG